MTMKSALVSQLFLGAFASLLVACSNSPQEPAPVPAPAPASPAPKPARISVGDVAPAKLYTRPALVVSRELIQVSNVMPPVDKIADEGTPEETKHLDILHIVKAPNAAVQKVQIDSAAEDAYLFLGPQVEGQEAIDAVLRGIVVLDPNGAVVNQRAGKPGRAVDKTPPMGSIPLAGLPTGTYTVKLSPEAAKVGVAIEVRQAQSPIVMKLKPSAAQHLLGGETSVDVTLEDGGAPILGATVKGSLITPEGKPGRLVTFSEVGGGVYRTKVQGVLGEEDGVGAYLVDVVATGTSGQKAFTRNGRTGFHYGIPTARLANVGEPRIIPSEDGRIEAFEVDLDLESSSLDRIEVSGTLAATAPDGQEHPVAIAHTGVALDPGKHVMTLRFEAGHVRLSRLAGTLSLRNLRVYSLGTHTLFQREHTARGLKFADVSRDKLVPTKNLTPAMKQLIEEGLLGE